MLNTTNLLGCYLSHHSLDGCILVFEFWFLLLYSYVNQKEYLPTVKPSNFEPDLKMFFKNE